MGREMADKKKSRDILRGRSLIHPGREFVPVSVFYPFDRVEACMLSVISADRNCEARRHVITRAGHSAAGLAQRKRNSSGNHIQIDNFEIQVSAISFTK